jgi:hypothetical protein
MENNRISKQIIAFKHRREMACNCNRPHGLIPDRKMFVMN